MQIDIETLVTTVRKIASENQSVRYKAPDLKVCSYADGIASNGKPGCLFGQALAQLGIDSETLRTIDDMPNASISHALKSLNIAASQQTIDWCETVQDQQDRGETWGFAIDHADRLHS